MSSYVLMRVLESRAERYDRGIRLLSRGRIGEMYARVADLVGTSENRVLDIGCGTGGVALACAARGAEVVGIDVNADMLEVARSKPLPVGMTGSVEWLQLSTAEIEDRFEPKTFDAVTACLVMSELSADERAYTLAVALTRLRPGGQLVLADEVVPDSSLHAFLHRALRMPLAVVTYLLTQTTTCAVRGLDEELQRAGFVEVDEDRLSPRFTIVSGHRPLEAA
jgi:demethylmenaquinone methyltransferase/2-methoxy-6-polyprenyl-1,4-benzoquinol methylase